MQSRIKGGLFQGVDFLAVLYYLLLGAAGGMLLCPVNPQRHQQKSV